MEEQGMPKTVVPKKNDRTKYRIKKIDLISLIGVCVALFFGCLGIVLTYKIIDTSVDIKHFDTLLNKTDNSLSQQAKLLSDNGALITLSQRQIDSLVSINKTLTQQLSVISRQYALNIKEQIISDSNAVNFKLTNEARFYIATQNLHLLTWQPYKYPSVLSDWPIPLRIEFLNKATTILNGQLDNPFLLSNKYMLQDWLNVRDSVFWYTQDINFLPQHPIDTLSFRGLSYNEIQSTLTKEWRNCFLGVASIEQSSSQFMLYYRFRGTKTRKWPYRQIKDFKR